MSSNNKKFIELCEKGKLEEAKQFYSTSHNINFNVYDDEAFKWSCKNGKLEVARLLFSLPNHNINAEYDEYFKYVCENGNLEIAKILLALPNCNNQY